MPNAEISFLLRFRVLTVQGPRYIREVPRSSRAAGCDQKTMHRAIAERGLAVDALDRGNLVSPCRMRDSIGINKSKISPLAEASKGQVLGGCMESAAKLPVPTVMLER